MVDVFQPCVSFNKINTYQWYMKRVYKLQNEEKYDAFNRTMAFEKALEWGDRIPIGIFYQEKGKPTYVDQVPVLKKGALVRQGLRTRVPDEIKNQFV